MGRTVEIRGVEFPGGGEAVQYANAAGGEAVLVGGKHLVVRREEADRMAEAGVAFAYLVHHETPDGTHRVMTIPVND